MIKILSAFFLSILVFTPLARAQRYEGTLNGRVYTCKLIGWKIEIPEGFNILPRDSIKVHQNKDSVTIKDTSKLDSGQIIKSFLINFTKNRFNTFMSYVETDKRGDPLTYEKLLKQFFEIGCRGYARAGVKIDTFTEKVMIQGFEFISFNTTFYSAGGDIKAYEIRYNSYIYNYYDFGVSILYNNEADKKTMMDAFKNSKFTKK